MGQKIDPMGQKIDPIQRWIDLMRQKIDLMERKIDLMEHRIDPMGRNIDPMPQKIDPMEHQTPGTTRLRGARRRTIAPSFFSSPPAPLTPLLLPHSSRPSVNGSPAAIRSTRLEMLPKVLNYVRQKPRQRVSLYCLIPLIAFAVLVGLLLVGVSIWLWLAWKDPRNWN